MMRKEEFDYPSCSYFCQSCISNLFYKCKITGVKCEHLCKSSQITQDKIGIIDSQGIDYHKCNICRNNLFKQKRPAVNDGKLTYFFTYFCPYCNIVYKANEFRIPYFFNFQHPYNKLAESSFTTIRSVKYMERKSWIRTGQVGWITLKRKPFALVEFIKYEDKTLKEIPLEVLRRDAESVKTPIKSKTDFVNLLNEFVRQAHGYIGNHSLKTKKRVFYLEKRPFNSIIYPSNEVKQRIDKIGKDEK